MSIALRPLVLLGAGGHARVLLALARAAGYQVLGVCDPMLAARGVSRWEELDVLGDDAAVSQLSSANIDLMLGVGQVVKGSLRAQLYAFWRAKGYAFPALVHPFAWVAPGVALDEGVQVMAGAVIQPGCTIGENSIVNTRASVDHDCRVGRDVHVAPGATLCGTVAIDDGAYIGSGATVIQGLHVGANSVVGAGVTLMRDLAPATTIIGAGNQLR